MEDQVIHFLQSVKENFPLVQFEIVHNSLSPTLKHFIIKENNFIKGFGGGHGEFEAIQKAYSEFVERKALHELNKLFGSFKTSNGFAAHVNYELARTYSRNEVIERDAFLISWHGKIAPYWLGTEETLNFLSLENKKIFELHLKNKLKLRLGLIATSKNIFSAIACVELLETKQAFFIDCKSGENLSILLNSLIESVAYNSHFMIMGYGKKINLSKNPLKKPMDHFNYYLKSRRGLDWFFQGSSHVFEFPSEVIITYNCNVDILLEKKDIKRIVCFSESENMQPYYCGKLTSKTYNKQRHDNIFGKNVMANKQVHPLS